MGQIIYAAFGFLALTLLLVVIALALRWLGRKILGE